VEVVIMRNSLKLKKEEKKTKQSKKPPQKGENSGDIWKSKEK